MKFKADFPPKTQDQNQELIFNPITQKVLATHVDKLNSEEFFELTENELSENTPVLQDKEIQALYEHYVEEYQTSGKKNLAVNLGWHIMDYVSDRKTIDEKTQERTLDRAYKLFFEIAEKHLDAMYKLSTRTHHMFEFVKPDTFFDTYLKIRGSRDLNKYFGGEQFSQLEYNVTYCGTEKYINSLIRKIDFKSAESCSQSSQLMNIAASLADYANSGSYSGSYNIGEKITDAFEKASSDKDAIYLLAAKAKFIAERLKEGLPPFVHQNRIFSVAPGIIGCNNGGTLLMSEATSTSEADFNEYKEISSTLDRPPQELVDEAVRLGQDYVNWEPDRTLMDRKRMYHDKLMQSMREVNAKDITLLQDTEISQKQLAEYQNLITTDFRTFLEEEFNIKFETLTIPEQFFFLEYIQTQTQETVDRVKEFSHVYGSKGVRTFLSIEQGGKEMGDKILALGETLPESLARQVFEKYGLIVDTAMNAQKTIELLIPPEQFAASHARLAQIRESLLIRARDFLVKYHLNKDKNFKESLQGLDRFNEEIFLFAETYKASVESGEPLSLEEIEHIGLKVLSHEERRQHANTLWQITKENRKGFITAPQEMNEREARFRATIDDTHTDFYTLEYKGSIAAFCSFTDQGGDTVLVESLNVESEIKGTKIGGDFFNVVTHKVAQTKNIVGYVHAGNAGSLPYYERIGFHVESVMKDNKPYYKITLAKQGSDGQEVLPGSK
jgi:N-acetylglutamate synthase-like GNAT family acetyltransferase/uncharacterized protein YciU (UPF0263 family)